MAQTPHIRSINSRAVSVFDSCNVADSKQLCWPLASESYLRPHVKHTANVAHCIPIAIPMPSVDARKEEPILLLCEPGSVSGSTQMENIGLGLGIKAFRHHAKSPSMSPAPFLFQISPTTTFPLGEATSFSSPFQPAVCSSSRWPAFRPQPA